MEHNYNKKQDKDLQLDELTKLTPKKPEHTHTKNEEHDHDHEHEDDDPDHEHGAEATPGKPGWMEHWTVSTKTFFHLTQRLVSLFKASAYPLRRRR